MTKRDERVKTWHAIHVDGGVFVVDWKLNARRCVQASISVYGRTVARSSSPGGGLEAEVLRFFLRPLGIRGGGGFFHDVQSECESKGWWLFKVATSDTYDVYKLTKKELE
jgi:hypothetical protein